MQLSNIERQDGVNTTGVVFRLPELQAQCSGDKFVV
jgi:cation transport regulator ChaC